jgi:alpha-glucosidase
VIEVHRAAGLTAKRNQLDGFAGAITRLRGAYDAMHATWPVSDPPDELIDAMQSGDRLGYHPERAVEEIAHFHEVLPEAEAAITKIGGGFDKALDAYAQQLSKDNWQAADVAANRQKRMDALTRAGKLVSEAAAQ